MVMAYNWHEDLPALHAVSMNENFTAWLGCCPSPIRLPWWVVKWFHSHGDWLRGIRQTKSVIVWGFFLLFFPMCRPAPVWYQDTSAAVIQLLVKEKMLVHISTFPDIWKLGAGASCQGCMFFLTFSTKRINERLEKNISLSACLF